jgi:predicted RND superfamily exporter protein
VLGLLSSLTPTGPSILSSDGGSPLFRVWAQIVVRHRWACLVGILLVTAVAVWTIKERMVVDNSIEAFGASNSDSALVLEEFRDVFGRDEMFVVIAEGPVFSTPFLEKLERLHGELEAIDLVVPSLGERKSAREEKRGRLKTDPSSGSPSDSAGAPVLPGIDDAFAEDGGFDSFGDDDGWGEEEGGTIIERVTSLVNVRKTAATPDGGIEVRELIDEIPDSPEGIEALRRQVMGHAPSGIPPDRTLVGQVVGKAGRHAGLMVQTQFMNQKDTDRIYQLLLEMAAEYEAADFKTYVSGGPALASGIDTLMIEDLTLLGVLALAVLFIILFVMFRHPIGALAPGIVCVLAGVWAFGFSAALGIPMTMLSQILPAFIICVGVADSVHLQSVYRLARRDGHDNNDAIIYAVSQVGVPVFFTSLTTAVGLFSFRFASVTAVGEMGTVGAAGVFMAFFHTVVFLPIALTLNKKSHLGAGREGGKDYIGSFLATCAEISGSGAGRASARPWTVLLWGMVLTGIAIYGMSLLRVWHNPVSWVPKTEKVRQALDVNDEHLGGTGSVLLMVEGTTERGVKDVALVEGLAGLEREMLKFPYPRGKGPLIENTMSLLDLVRESNRALMGGGEEHYEIPGEQAALNDRFMAFENAGPDEMSRLMTVDGRVAQLSARMRWLDATSYIPFVAFLEDAIERHIPASVGKVRATGSMYTLLSTIGALIMDLLTTFGLAFAVISVLMVLLLKDVKLGLVAMVPNLLPILFIQGLMGHTDIPIDMANILIASVALGIAVDDTIHFLHHFREHHSMSGDVEAAIGHALTHSGRAMVVTSIILCAGFSVYLAATMINMQRFGALIAITVLMALLLDLILAPALLRIVYGKPKGQPKADSGALDHA